MVIDAARAELNQVFAIAERLDAKVRDQITLALAFFAAGQVIVGWFLGTDAASGWTVAVLVAAAGTALTLAIAVKRSLEAWGLEHEQAISHQRIRSLGEEAMRGDPRVGAALVGLYAALLESRLQTNERRVQKVKDAWNLITLAMTEGFAFAPA